MRNSIRNKRGIFIQIGKAKQSNESNSRMKYNWREGNTNYFKKGVEALDIWNEHNFSGSNTIWNEKHNEIMIYSHNVKSIV